MMKQFNAVTNQNLTTSKELNQANLAGIVESPELNLGIENQELQLLIYRLEKQPELTMELLTKSDSGDELNYPPLDKNPMEAAIELLDVLMMNLQARQMV